MLKIARFPLLRFLVLFQHALELLMDYFRFRCSRRIVTWERGWLRPCPDTLCATRGRWICASLVWNNWIAGKEVRTSRSNQFCAKPNRKRWRQVFPLRRAIEVEPIRIGRWHVEMFCCRLFNVMLSAVMCACFFSLPNLIYFRLRRNIFVVTGSVSRSCLWYSLWKIFLLTVCATKVEATNFKLGRPGFDVDVLPASYLNDCVTLSVIIQAMLLRTVFKKRS